MNDSKRFHALQQARVALQDEGRKLRALEELTDEQEARLLAIPGELDALDAKLAPYEALHARERAGSAATIPVGPNSAITVRDRSEDDPWRGFRNVADFARSVQHAAGVATGRAQGRVDERLLGLYERNDGPMEGSAALRGGERYQPAPGMQAAPTGFHEEGHSAEGYMVPPAGRQQMFELTFADDDIMGMIGPEPTESNAVDLTADESTPWGATGIKAYWRAEGSQMTPTQLATEGRQLRLHPAYAFALATEELLQDAPLLNSRLTRGAGRALGWLLSEAAMWGDGAGKPLGWMKSPALVTVSKESGPQTADTVVAANLTKMYSRRLKLPGGRWMWFANSDIVPQLVDLKLGNEPSWTAQNQGLRAAPEGMILGLPVNFTEHADTLGDLGDLQLVDLNGYLALRKAQGIDFQTSIHLYFDYGVQAFRWMVRVGGMPFLSKPVSTAKSSTRSSFITLEAR
jgi:HK97 family phage major capsid protein